MPRVLLLLFVALLFPARAQAEDDTLAAAKPIAPIALDLREERPPEPTIVPPSTPVRPIEPPAPAPSPSWYRSTWVWVGAGAVVAVVCTGLLLAYGTEDRYPRAGFGTQGIGAGP